MNNLKEALIMNNEYWVSRDGCEVYLMQGESLNSVKYFRFNESDLVVRNDENNFVMRLEQFREEANKLGIPVEIICEFLENEDPNKWHKRFLEMAKLISTWSKDPSTQVSAVIVDKNRRIISTGYNGFAVGVHDDKERLENRELKYPLTLHAEENALSFAKQDLTDCVLYVYGLPPCAHCASLIIQSGIKQVYTYELDEENPRWKDSIALTKQIFREAGVTLTFIKKD